MGYTQLLNEISGAMEKYIFDIPIYRCPIEKHTQELDNEKNKRLQSIIDIHGPEVIHSESYKWIGNDFDRNQWYPWRYNEVIGWIRLYRLGSQVRGELWFTNAKKIRRDLKRKKIYYIGKSFERPLYRKMSSNEIFETICCELEHQKKESPIKDRFLDMEMFLNAGRFINWKELFGFTAQDTK